MFHDCRRLSMLVLLASTFQVSLSAQLRAQQPNLPKLGDDPGAPQGKPIFVTSCAACHGLDGRGGERGPDISTRREVQRLSDEALVRIVRDGIAGTGMPAFRSLGSPRIHAVVRHLRTLQGRSAAAQLPGDPERGKILFFGKAGCLQCHMANGEGGFIGSDLSSYAGTESADDIRSAITDPNRNPNPRQRTVIVTTMDGKMVTGIARNEDNFSLQLQTFDGTFHFFSKAELQTIEYQPRSLMPADYASRLRRQELDDIVSYLMIMGRTHHQPQAEKE